MRSQRLIAVGAGCIWAWGAAHAAQTVSFTYDALGRLIQSQVQNGPEGSLLQTFDYDPAGNRKSYQVSGTTGQGAATITMTSTFVNQTLSGTPLTVYFGSSSVSGTVNFTENGVFLGSTFVSNGQATVILEGFAKGAHTITASYWGDGTYAPKTMTFTIRVQNLSWLPAVLELLQ